MSLEQKFAILKEQYENFLRNGIGSLQALKSEANRLFVEARASGASRIKEELEDILIDLMLLEEQSKCSCHANTRGCRC